MPKAGQIIPSHRFPHEMVVVNDNTEYTNTVPSDSDDSIKMLFVFSSPKGEDNKVKTITNGLTQFLDEFGQGPFSVYGQPYLNAYNAFASGNVVGHCLRVAAPNATYAYSVLVALYKVDETGKVTVRFRTKTGDRPLTSKDEMDALYTSPSEVIAEGPDAGFTEVKLLTVASLGRGSYGKKLLYGISTNTGGDKENEYKNYIFSVYENFGTLKEPESFAVAFNEDAIVGNTSLFVDGVIGDPRNGSSKITTLTNIAGFEQILEAYNDANDNSEFTMNDFDVLLGINKHTRNAIANYEIDTMTEGVVVLNAAGGIALVGGEDGDLDEAAEASVRTAALKEAYIAAFSGATDPMIASKNKFPTNLMLDANFDPEVKHEMVALAEKRTDCMVVLDCGTGIKTKRSPITYLKNNLDSFVNNKVEMIDSICGKVRDPYSKKIVTVTNTLLLAADYPNHWARFGGKHVPLAGNVYGVITGFIDNTIYPVYDEAVDADIMDELCEEKINFARINAKQNIIRATQTTRQKITSNLSEANNVFILLDIKRDCEELCADYQYNFSEPEDIARFNKDAETVISKYSDSQVRTIEASFDKNDWEAERGILHLYVGFTHKDLVKTTIVEIDVNRGGSVE